MYLPLLFILYIHTYIHTGRAYYILGEFETAMNHYRKGLKFDPEHKGIKDMYRVIKKVQDFQKKAKKSNAAVSVCMYVCTYGNKFMYFKYM